MTYWWLLASLAAALVALSVLLPRQSHPGEVPPPRSRRIRSWHLLAFVLAGLAVLLFFVALASIRTFMGPESWYERSPARELLLFASMGLGMVAHVLSVAIEERRERRRKNPRGRHPVRIDPWELLYPFLASTICFGAILEATRATELGLMVLFFAFQNGFFWQAVVGSARAR